MKLKSIVNSRFRDDTPFDTSAGEFFFAVGPPQGNKLQRLWRGKARTTTPLKVADQILPSDASSANFFCSYFWALAESNTVSASSFAVGRCNAVNSCWRRRCVLEAADQFFTLPNENTLPANNFSCLVAHVVPRVQVGFVASPTGNHFPRVCYVCRILYSTANPSHARDQIGWSARVSGELKRSGQPAKCLCWHASNRTRTLFRQTFWSPSFPDQPTHLL